MQKKLTQLATDVLGMILVLASVPLAWVPGPGGFPLFLAGLGLLSINHHWARRLLITARKHGLHVSKLLIRENRWWQLGVDVLGAGAIITAIWMFVSVDSIFLKTLSFSLTCIGLYLVLVNRGRWDRIRPKKQEK